MRVILVFILSALAFLSAHAQNRSLLIIAGGHSFDTIAFFKIFDQMEGVGYDFLIQPEANRFLAITEEIPYDVLLFYDMWQPITEEEKAAYIRLTETGKPMIFMHHSLVSYQEWPEFEQIIGGRYAENKRKELWPEHELSTYKHDVWVDVQIVEASHPVTAGLRSFRIFDEVYGNYRVGEKVRPLLKTSHPESTPVIAWENKYNNSTIIYLQPGHGADAYQSTEFRQLISQSIKYLTPNK
jgi:uncharacterized protein